MRERNLDSDTGRVPSRSDIESFAYVDLLALLAESNLPPGGMRSITELAVHSQLQPNTKVLHAGSNAGFLSRELHRRTGAAFVGIDISKGMVAAARRRASKEGLNSRLSYQVADMRELPYGDGTFDAVVSGGALAFVENQEDAVKEWVRVTRDFGVIADIEFFYRESPPRSLRRAVAEIIDVEVPEYRLEYWRSLFEGVGLLASYEGVGHARSRPPDAVRNYCDAFVKYATPGWPRPSRAALRERLRFIMEAFNDNLRYLSYVVLVYSRRPNDSEPLLFY